MSVSSERGLKYGFPCTAAKLSSFLGNSCANSVFNCGFLLFSNPSQPVNYQGWLAEIIQQITAILCV